MNRIAKNILRIPLAIDGIIALGFGLYSWFYPLETFGTIIFIPEVHSSVFLGILSSLSLFYILIGLTCFIGIKSPFPLTFGLGY